MTNKELIKIAYELGAHPYNVCGMAAALQKGIEIGKQETIDKACEWLSKQGQDWWEGYGIPFSLEDFKKAMENRYD